MALLECEKLRISFGGLVAINQVDFSIHPGEVVGLIGPNGSGKTTFFNLITGIYRPSDGKMLFKNQPLIGRSPAEISRMGMSRTFQRSRLFLELSVLDNVLSGMCYHAHSGLLDAVFRKKKLLRAMEPRINQAATLLNYFSDELGSSLNKKAGDLPLADRRRLEICRALGNDPDLLLLDEPSAGMDPEETRILMEDIEKVMKRKPEIAIVIIEHDLTVIQGTAHRVVVLNYGQKIAEGPFKSVAEDPGVRQAYLGKVEIRA
jgi:branched-chain amino acid transport system ATP-binding protein